MEYIYLDYAATTPVDPRVVEKMLGYLTHGGAYANPSSLHEAGQKAKKAIELARQQVAELIHADANEIIFTSGATESNNFAIKNVAEFYQNKGKHIVTLTTEHKAVLACCHYLEKKGFSVTYLSPEKNGLLDINKLNAVLRKDTILVSVMHVNNEIGIIQNLDAIANLTRTRDILLHVDAAQSPGKVAVDMSKTSVDLMSLCAHKAYGPKGIGAIYIRKNPHVKFSAQLHGGNQEQGLRSGTLPTHQIVGMGEAFHIAKQELQRDMEHIYMLRENFIKGLEPYIRINGDLLHSVPNILNVRFKSISATELLSKIPDMAASTASACHGNSSEVSYVLRAIGLNEEEGMRSVRFSFGRFTTQEEINRAISQIRKHLI